MIAYLKSGLLTVKHGKQTILSYLFQFLRLDGSCNTKTFLTKAYRAKSKDTFHFQLR